MRVYFQFFLMILNFSVWGQEIDSLIYAQGNIINGATQEPIVATIFYESLPYGSRIGTQHGNSFSFPLFDNQRYSITVEAPGFAPAKYMLDPSEANVDQRVIRDIALELPTSAAQAAETAHTVGRVMRLDNLIFDQGRAQIGEESHPELNSVVRMLDTNPSMVIQLEGHTDYLGDPKANQKLSKARVKAVRDYLVSQGISKKKVKTKAFGGSQPLSREDTAEAHAMNRRVEVRILAN